MKSKSKKDQPVEAPVGWKERVMAAFDRLEAPIPEPDFMRGELPEWVQKAMREVLKALVPEAGFKLSAEVYPRELGALFGAKLGHLHWMKDENGFAKSDTAAKLEALAATLAPEKVEQYNQECKKLVAIFVGYIATMIEAKTEVLNAAASAKSSEQKEFFDAYTKALGRTEKGTELSSIGTTATPVYILLAYRWRHVETMPSIPAVHRFCITFLGAGQIGELKTFQKLCQRIGLKLRTPGRPRKKR